MQMLTRNATKGRRFPTPIGPDSTVCNGALSLDQRLQLREVLERSVRQTGERLLAFKGEIVDRTWATHGHVGSSADDEARYNVIASLETNLERVGLHNKIQLSLGFEDKPMAYIEEANGKIFLSAVIDELDGTRPYVAWQQALKGMVPAAAPHSAVSIMVSDDSGEPLASAVYTLSTGQTFTAVRVDEEWLSFLNGVLLSPLALSVEVPASPPVFVAAYSNKQRQRKAAIEEHLLNAGFALTEGSRSSTCDILAILQGASYAYIDVRAFDGEEYGAVLRAYDIAGIVPVCWSLHLAVADLHGRPIPPSLFARRDSMVNIVVGFPHIVERVTEAIRPILA